VTKHRVAFFGLGIMGSGMARRLLGAGFPLAVYNRNAARAAPLAAEGASPARSPREAAEGADVLLAMVSDDNASRAIWLGGDGALAAARPGAVCIESSTVSVGWVRELSAAAHARGCGFLDAPVTGSRTHAAGGELNFLVGGAAATLDSVRPVLAAMSRTIAPLGPVGSGAQMKLINNFLCGVQVASLAEAVAMIERSGLDRARALEILTSGAPGSPIVKTVAERMAARNYSPNFLLRLMAKDLAYAAHEASTHSIGLKTGAAAIEIFQNGVSGGHGGEDIAAIVEQFRAARGRS